MRQDAVKYARRVRESLLIKEQNLGLVRYAQYLKGNTGGVRLKRIGSRLGLLLVSYPAVAKAEKYI
jgi:hypothetical protein